MSRTGKGASPPDSDGFVSTREFAQMCGVHVNTVTNWHRTGYAVADAIMPRTGALRWNPERAPDLAATPRPFKTSTA